MKDAIKVLLVDDQESIRMGFKAVLSSDDRIKVIGEAKDGKDAYFQTHRERPDVILMDICMPIMDGVEATHLIKKEFPDTKIIILTTFDDDQYIIKAMHYGASGYLLKDVEVSKLKSAIFDSMDHHVILPNQIAKKLFTHLPSLDHHLTEKDFTSREKDIILYLVQGKTNQEIADILFLSLGTVKNYLSSIYSKLDVYDRGNAIIQLKRIGF